MPRSLKIFKESRILELIEENHIIISYEILWAIIDGIDSHKPDSLLWIIEDDNDPEIKVPFKTLSGEWNHTLNKLIQNFVELELYEMADLSKKYLQKLELEQFISQNKN